MNQEPFKWPPRSRLTFYNGRGKPLLSSTDRLFDLSDNLMLYWPHHSRTVTMGIVINKPKGKWAYWDEEALAHVEGLIRYDLGFDAYRVRISRLLPAHYLDGDQEFRWKLHIRE